MTNTYKHYREKLAEHSAIWGDQYALTMAQGLFSLGEHDTRATFHAYIRKNPFNGGYLLTGGQNIINEWLDKHWRFDDIDLENLRNDVIPDDEGNMMRLYSDEFIDHLANAKMELTIDAMPEGEIAFPDEPIYRVHGPLWQCLMVETPILNVTNSQSLFATLASRLSTATGGDPILEFGLRRAQCIGGLEPTRGAYLGGIAASSNNEAKKFYGIPTKGTFAHAWVMAQEDEIAAFVKYANVMPHNGIFLVDTYETLEGVRRASRACKEAGVTLKGIRLDSGDLAYLSKEARKILDKEGFPQAKIAASNDLDERTIRSLKEQGARIDIWGIGTNLATSKDQPALGAVYKLGALYNSSLDPSVIEQMRAKLPDVNAQISTDFMRDVIKLSEDAIKVTIPGEMDILRYLSVDENGVPLAYNGDTLISPFGDDPIRDGRLARDIVSVRKNDGTLRKTFAAATHAFRPLVRTFDNGRLVAPTETVHDARERAAKALSMLDETHRRLLNPHLYVVGLEEDLYNKRQKMIAAARGMAA